MYSAYQCFSEAMTISCPTGSTIQIISAFYGQFYDTCDKPFIKCCPPNSAYDCTESVEEWAPVDWLVLEEICNGQPSCEFTVQGLLNSCADLETSDYMTVNYQCLPS